MLHIYCVMIRNRESFLVSFSFFSSCSVIILFLFFCTCSLTHRLFVFAVRFACTVIIVIVVIIVVIAGGGEERSNGGRTASSTVHAITRDGVISCYFRVCKEIFYFWIALPCWMYSFSERIGRNRLEGTRE